MTSVKFAWGDRRSVADVISLHTVRHAADDPLSSATKVASLIATAERLRRSSATPLCGRNLALLRAPGPSEDLQLQRAAEELGARVAVLEFRPHGRANADGDVTNLAYMLGRMYDAIDCDDLDAAAKQVIEAHAGVPVFPGLARDTHPARVIADLWALCEKQPPSDRHITFIGNGRVRRARMFVTAARTTGVTVEMNPGADSEDEETLAIADATRPSHWVLRIGGTEIDREALQERHRRIMQAVLVHALLGV